MSLCFHKVKQSKKVNLASEIMTKILTNEMEFWHVKHGFRSMQFTLDNKKFSDQNFAHQGFSYRAHLPCVTQT